MASDGLFLYRQKDMDAALAAERARVVREIITEAQRRCYPDPLTDAQATEPYNVGHVHGEVAAMSDFVTWLQSPNTTAAEGGSSEGAYNG